MEPRQAHTKFLPSTAQHGSMAVPKNTQTYSIPPAKIKMRSVSVDLKSYKTELSKGALRVWKVGSWHLKRLELGGENEPLTTDTIAVKK
jgi:hypothetical protein